jgi:hypothetical protein
LLTNATFKRIPDYVGISILRPADRHAEDYRYEVKKVNNNTKMKIHLAAGGGFAAILTKE